MQAYITLNAWCRLVYVWNLIMLARPQGAEWGGGREWPLRALQSGTSVSLCAESRVTHLGGKIWKLGGAMHVNGFRLSRLTYITYQGSRTCRLVDWPAFRLQGDSAFVEVSNRLALAPVLLRSCSLCFQSQAGSMAALAGCGGTVFLGSVGGTQIPGLGWGSVGSQTTVPGNPSGSSSPHSFQPFLFPAEIIASLVLAEYHNVGNTRGKKGTERRNPGLGAGCVLSGNHRPTPSWPGDNRGWLV